MILRCPICFRLLFLCLVGAGVLAGCGPTNYKQDADERVYAIIDEQWEPEFGPRTNYRIGDVPPAPNALAAGEAGRLPGILSLPEALSAATAGNREYQTQKEWLYTAALDLRLVRHGYETQLFGGGSLLYQDDGESSEVATEANIGFNRLLATGMEIGTRVAVAWADVLAGTGDRGLATIFSAAVAQPLLRGRDPMVVREKLTLAERITLYQIRTFNRFRKTFAVSVATQYFQAVELQDVVRNTQAYLDSLVLLHSQVAKLVGAGLLPRLEEDALQQEILKTRDVLVVAEREHEQFLDSFKITLGVPPTTEFQVDATILDSLRTSGMPLPGLALAEAVETGLRGRLDVANGADAVLDAQRAVYVAADALRADLRVAGQVNVNSHGDASVSAGPILAMPLDRVSEQTAYRKALIGLDQSRRDYDRTADTVRLEVRDAYRRLVETAERYGVLSEGLELAGARLKRTTALLQFGRVSSRRVLSAERDSYEAKNDATDALTDYAIAMLAFYRDTGVLQVRPDGMWQAEILPTPLARTRPIAEMSTARE